MKLILFISALLLAIALAASIGAGVGYALLREQLRPAFFTMKGLRQATELPSLGAVTMVQSPAARWRGRLGFMGFSFATLSYLGIFALGAAYLMMKPSFPIAGILAGFLK